MENMSDLRVFFLDKDVGDMLEIVLHVEDKLCSHTMELKSKSKQKAITGSLK